MGTALIDSTSQNDIEFTSLLTTSLDEHIFLFIGTSNEELLQVCGVSVLCVCVLWSMLCECVCVLQACVVSVSCVCVYALVVCCVWKKRQTCYIC